MKYTKTVIYGMALFTLVLIFTSAGSGYKHQNFIIISSFISCIALGYAIADRNNEDSEFKDNQP